jgi:glycosyltransferase involved in cell wall biosynthesis
MVGEGSAEAHWRRLSSALSLDGRIDWQPWQSSDGMRSVYRGHDMLLFPALHDSGGLVALEAMTQGLPVVCLRLGGPASLVDNSCGRTIESHCKSENEVIDALARAMLELSWNMVRQPISDAARMRGSKFSWRQKVERIYGEIA